MDQFKYQEGLNEVVTNKVHRMIDNHQPVVMQTVERLLREAEISRDFIVPIGVEQRGTCENPIISFEGDDKLMMRKRGEPFTLHNNAVRQLAEKMDIPSKYLRELSEGSAWQRQLAAEILNKTSGWTPRTRVMIRTVGDQVRGVLSDSYRRLNSEIILTAFMKTALNEGAVACDALMTDTKVWIETILPEPICIPTRLNGTVIIYMGVRFSTSDYGDGSLDLRTFLLNGVCLNGMVRERTLKQVHLGGRLPENLQLSEETYRQDTKTVLLTVRDATRQLYNKDIIRKKALEIERAEDTAVDFEAELKKLVKNNKILKNEEVAIQKILMDHNPEDGLQGSPSLLNLTQALTAYGRNQNSARTRDFAEIAGELMDRVKQ